jgi:hypothetical protein
MLGDISRDKYNATEPFKAENIEVPDHHIVNERFYLISRLAIAVTQQPSQIGGRANEVATLFPLNDPRSDAVVRLGYDAEFRLLTMNGFAKWEYDQTQDLSYYCRAQNEVDDICQNLNKAWELYCKYLRCAVKINKMAIIREEAKNGLRI